MATTQLRGGLKEWGERALELGLSWFSGGNITPFILLAESSGEGQLIDLQEVSGAVGPELVEVGRTIIRDSEPGQFYALGWDGYLTTAGTLQDAVFAEVGAGGEARAYVLALRYEKTSSGELAMVGPPVVAAETAYLWARQHKRQRTSKRE